MVSHRLPSALLLVSSLGTVSLPLQAIEPGVYFGAGVGVTDDQILQESDSGTRVFGGINITPYIGIEVAAVDLGDYANGTLTQEGVSYEIVGYLPLSHSTDVYGKFGIFDWEVSNGFETHTGDDTSFGVGINVKIGSNLNLRGEWQSFLDVDGGDVDMLSANVSISF